MADAATAAASQAANTLPIPKVDAVDVLHQIPGKVETITAETARDVVSKVGLLRCLRIIDPTSLAAADDAYRRAYELRTAIEKQRVALKAPVLELERAIDGAAKPVLQLLDAELAKARALIEDWNARERRRVEEEARKAREAAEAERRAEEARQAAERKRLEEQRAAEAAAAAELSDILGEEVAAPPAAPAPEPVVARTVIKPPAAPAAALSSAVTSQTRLKPVIDDPEVVPHQLEGEQLVEFRLGAIERLLRRGVKVPGCRLVPTTTPTTKA